MRPRPFHWVWTKWRLVHLARVIDSPCCIGDPRCGEAANALQIAKWRDLELAQAPAGTIWIRWRMAHADICPEYVKGLKSGRLTRK